METIGDRIRALRGSTLTQQELADTAGVSVSLVRRLEQSQRHTVSIATLHKLAGALDVEAGTLLGKQRHLPGETSGVQQIRRVLTSVDDLLDEVVDDGEPVGRGQAQRLVDYAWGLYWSGRYDTLAAVLPATLTQLRATARHASPHDSAAAQELLARGYWAAGCTLVHLGASDASWLAIRHALAAADRGADELLAAVLRGSVSWQLLVQGRFDEACRVARRAAAAIEPAAVGAASLAHRSVYGSLLLGAATATGRDGHVVEARALLQEAATVAALNGGVDRTDYESPFGRAQVVMQTVDVHVVTEHYDLAVTAARDMPRDAALPLAARARHLTDTAMAHTHLGDR